MTTPASLASLVESKGVIVCVGSGGVGKTTTSAVIGLHEALRGRKVLVLTIDPAKRLANSLGVEELSNQATRIPLERFVDDVGEASGELWAMMLDMKQSFDDLVRRYAPEDTQHDILNNRIYEFFSTSVAGTQEYAAAERLYELRDSADFDLIVLDTPPTTHALDFLEAPTRIADAIENKAMQLLYKPSVFAGKKGFGILSMGTSYVMKTIGKFTGTQLLDEFATFLRSFSVLFDGLKERSGAVRELLLSDTSTFVVITAPDPLTIDEALFFYRKLGSQSVRVGGFVVNRVHGFELDVEQLERPAVVFANELREAVTALHDVDPDSARDLSERLRRNAQEFRVLVDVDAASIERLARHVPTGVPVCRVPYFDTDIHSLRGLERARRAIFGS